MTTPTPPPPDATNNTPDQRPAGSFVSAVRVVAGVTLISRFGGLFRDAATARVFGDSVVASAFNFAFMIPNVFRRLFGEGALSAAFIPEYASLDDADRPRAGRYASLIIALALAATLVFTILLELVILAALLLAPPDPERTLALGLSMLLAPYMPMVCIAALFAGMLQTHHRFALPAAGPIILNAAMLAGALVAYLALDMTPTQTAYFVAGAVLLSGAVLVVWLALALRPYVGWSRNFQDVGEPAKRTLKRFLPALLGLGALQLSSIADGLIATYPALVGPTFLGLTYPLDETTNGILQYSQRLYQFPLGVFGVAVATAVFPALSRAANTPHLFLDMLRRGLRLSFFIAFPASLGLLLVREDAARVLFKGGNFSEEGVQRAAHILTGYAVSIWAFSANQTLTRAFYARGEMNTPVRISLLCVALNLLLNVTLIWVPFLREAAFGWSAAIAFSLQCILLARAARKLTHEPLLDRATTRAISTSLALSVAMAAPVLAVQALAPDSHDLTTTAARLAGATLLGALTFFALARLTRREELAWLLARSSAR